MLVSRLSWLAWYTTSCLLALPSPSKARFVNVTVDDSGPDHLTGELITYTPGLGVGWKLGQDCSDCTAGPQKALAYHQTWHDSTVSQLPRPLELSC
ncbi:hypothetical protein P691DRAFT_800447 [Macrolepiota fuliginosa MF-IS2]|uniref:Uncharacterized protein n=1 Tax=Macrolepiota fuliginosa MF-IS2 TaxID=1400762 RepID=A0A9P5XE60_9AGAR|nr:hypothetical protein P691DRAFT_800447 [Macrolepiota fuliginosa MF-IS2]